MWKKLKSWFSPSPNLRRSLRQPVDHIETILLFVNEKGYRLVNVSSRGLAFRSGSKEIFESGREYRGTIEIYQQKAFEFTFKVVWNRDGVIGCEVPEDPGYLAFLNSFRGMSLKSR